MMKIQQKVKIDLEKCMVLYILISTEWHGIVDSRTGSSWKDGCIWIADLLQDAEEFLEWKEEPVEQY